MKTVLDLMVSNDIHTAFVSLWHLLTSNTPRFEQAQAASLQNQKKHDETKETVISRLLENSPVKIRNCPTKYELAILEALDDYLYERYGAREESLLPLPLVTLENKDHIIYRRRLQRKAIRHAQQTGHIRAYLHHHWVIPCDINGYTISIKKLPDITALQYSSLPGKKTIMVYVGGFDDGIVPDWHKDQLPAFRASELTDTEQRWRSIEESLKEASEAKAQIVVFPELSICEKMRDRFSLWLDEQEHPFFFILPGTFHQKRNGAYYNYGELFSANGKQILSHRKLKRFSISPKEYEKIDAGNRIDLLDTPIGLMAMPICRDFCEEGAPFAELWQKIGADWHLVPAMGSATSISAHLKRADTLQRAHGATTVLSNQEPDPNQVDGTREHGFVRCSESVNTITPEKRCVSVDL